MTDMEGYGADQLAHENDALRDEVRRLREENSNYALGSYDLYSRLEAAERRAATADAKLKAAEEVIEQALEHSIANRDTKREFYRCYTYSNGKMPEWVLLAREYQGGE